MGQSQDKNKGMLPKSISSLRKQTAHDQPNYIKNLKYRNFLLQLWPPNAK